MNSKQIVLLEISIQLERLIGTTAEQTALEAHLATAQHHFVLSAYCHLPDFLAAHWTELHTIADYLAAHPQVGKEQPRLERLLDRVIDDPRAVLGQSSCWPLGDAIIAQQALPAAHVWTMDADFAPLLHALGLGRYTPTLV